MSTSFLSFLIYIHFGLALIAPLLPVESKHEVEINIWYGDQQRFGQIGRAQRWINVLGNISNPDKVVAAEYSLNQRPSVSLSLGSDLHRLALYGDFNVELSWQELEEGQNQLLISAVTKDQHLITKRVTLIIEKKRNWPLPYHINFAEVTNLQDVVQIVDGDWSLEKEGVRTRQKYYDRVLCMGDTTWRDYQALIKVTIHDWTPSQPGPPTYNVSHFGVALRWQGHHTDDHQPNRKWFPLGAQGEFLLKEKTDSCRWRILFDGVKTKPAKYADQVTPLQKAKPIYIKTQVATMPGGSTRYRFKQWPVDHPEPDKWDVEGFENNDYLSGALCLVPHNSDVTIHEIKVAAYAK